MIWEVVDVSFKAFLDMGMDLIDLKGSMCSTFQHDSKNVELDTRSSSKPVLLKMPIKVRFVQGRESGSTGNALSVPKAPKAHNSLLESYIP